MAHIAYAKGTIRKEDGMQERILIFGPVRVVLEEQGKG